MFVMTIAGTPVGTRAIPTPLRNAPCCAARRMLRPDARTAQNRIFVEEIAPWQKGKAKVLGTLEIILRDGAEPHAYSYVNKERCEELVAYPLVRPENDATVRRAEEIALDAWRALHCRDAGRIDLRCDTRGEPQFLEVNPLAGLHPFHSDLPMLCTALGKPYAWLVERIVESAAKRVKKRQN